jgi:hypothetical protein
MPLLPLRGWSVSGIYDQWHTKHLHSSILALNALEIRAVQVQSKSDELLTVCMYININEYYKPDIFNLLTLLVSSDLMIPEQWLSSEQEPSITCVVFRVTLLWIRPPSDWIAFTIVLRSLRPIPVNTWNIHTLTTIHTHVLRLLSSNNYVFWFWSVSCGLTWRPIRRSELIFVCARDRRFVPRTVTFVRMSLSVCLSGYFLYIICIYRNAYQSWE